ncbi:hypothetical protein ALC57_17382 [Trachymyrmex cornetzi]|uniref:Uncharacterized protein n=1 Tax=Trachymyrmex cornetzi TaxID=471704 RepID=A0A151IU63_9HYME|nr:hypothetical protein ALC57_17382 [Trachymyrmex cornetzi]
MVLKREEHQASSQAQVGACLNAFGSDISRLFNSGNLFNDKAKLALAHLADGVHLLADPLDDYLFGQDFSEAVKAAQACERAGRSVSKSLSPSGEKTLQPVNQRLRLSASASLQGNNRAPVRPSIRRPGVSLRTNRQHLNHGPGVAVVSKQSKSGRPSISLLRAVDIHNLRCS